MTTVASWTGRCFEDFAVGEVYQHRLGRTISETDNTWFTLLTLNTNPLHFNEPYARSMPLGKVLVNSGFTVALVLGMSVSDISENAVANLGWDDIRLTHPVHVGDTLWAESVVLSTRKSRSRPDAGIISVRTRGLNQDGDVCLTFRRSVLIPTREAHSARRFFPTAAEPIDTGVDGPGD